MALAHYIVARRRADFAIQLTVTTDSVEAVVQEHGHALPSKEFAIVCAYLGIGTTAKTYEELAHMWGVSKQRIDIYKDQAARRLVVLMIQAQASHKDPLDCTPLEFFTLKRARLAHVSPETQARIQYLFNNPTRVKRMELPAGVTIRYFRDSLTAKGLRQIPGVHRVFAEGMEAMLKAEGISLKEK